ncbi:MAG TPA: helix-turn-helix domain-containing GNAT family N-acetyltransferase [Rhodanobacteraceae bacterium]|jgi:DNA-binding MarR family transcriptional regulator/N-acetylglutamate synthase-like GNAT family acetyltransferase|nr:helix-turn-helix domain-containing GNAT family N-acetyltransferase [Rhodanobacteraceae bacterium]
MLARQIEAARRFNRFYTQRIGVLDEGLLESPFSLTEVRVMYELAHRRGVGAADLARELALDKGYLSRILKHFRAKNWLAHSVADDDGRRHVLALTASGRRAFAPLERRSQQQVRAMLAPLGAAQRQRVLDAMRTIEQDLVADHQSAADIVLRSHRPGDIGWVVQRHGELYAREYAWNEEFEGLVADIAAKFIRDLDIARERCWIAERDGARLGCIFLVAQNKTTAKLRLLLVEPEARGLGLGKRLIGECIAFARKVGYRRIVLWTQDNLDAARHLYARAGFRKTGEESHRSFGNDLIAETWTLKLAPTNTGRVRGTERTDGATVRAD